MNLFIVIFEALKMNKLDYMMLNKYKKMKMKLDAVNDRYIHSSDPLDFLIRFYEKNRTIYEPVYEKPTTIVFERPATEITYSDYSETFFDMTQIIDIERTDYSNLFKNNQKIETVCLPSMFMASNCESMFEGCTHLKNVFTDVPYTSITKPLFTRVESFKNAFKNCKKLELITENDFFESFNVSNCMDFSGMFEGCMFDTIHPLSCWNVNPNANFKGMFKDCPNIESFKCLEEWFPDMIVDEIIEKVC